jgi:hypothetical protein
LILTVPRQAIVSTFVDSRKGFFDVKYLLLTSAAAVVGPSILWFLKKTVEERHAPWVTAVGVPAVLALYSLFAAPAAGVSLFSWSAFLGFVLALVSGFLFDQDASLHTAPEKSPPKRNPAPLLLWGAGALLYVFAPTLGGLVDAWSGAVLAVGGGALAGQAANRAPLLLHARDPARPTGFMVPIVASNPRVTRYGGFIAAAIAVWLLLPSANSQTPPRPTVDHDNSRPPQRTTQPQPPPAERSGVPPAPPLGR